MLKKNKRIISAALALSTVITVSGCATGINYYPQTQHKNMLVKTKTESGSRFSDISAHLHIYSVNSDCTTYEHLGAVELSEPEIEVGLTTGKPLEVEIAFGIGGGFFSNSASVMRTSAVIKPQKGFFYEVDASYVDGIYNLEVLEKKSRNAKGKPLKTVQNCS